MWPCFPNWWPAQTIPHLLDKVSNHRGTIIAAATRVSARDIELTIQHNGDTDFTPWSAITGFEVLSNQQSLPMASVSRKDGKSIRIELEDDVPKEFSLRYL